MLSVGKIEKTKKNGLQVDGSDVLAMTIERTDKTTSGAALWLATDAGDYTFEYRGALLPVPMLNNSDVLASAGLLLSFVPFNYNL